MPRRLLPRRARWLLRLLARRAVLVPLALVAAALLLDVWRHGRSFAVRRPAGGVELDAPFSTACQEPDVTAPRENATLVMLARNADLAKAVRTLESVERHFNRWFHYPVVFLNDEPWSDDFVRALRAAASGDTRFEVIPPGEWTFPSFVDPEDARQSIAQQGRDGILYAGLETYHHMCRFYSG